MSARYLATKILTTVLQGGISLNEAFARFAPPTTLDVSLVKELCYGCLRYYPRLQAIIRQLLARPLKPKDKDIEILMALGLYQMLAMRIPEHAAVAETVNATKKLGKTWARGVVNAVLRNFQRSKDSLLKDITEQEAQFAHPTWLLHRIQQAWPNDWQTIVEANNQHPPLTLRVNLKRQSRDAYLQLLVAKGIEAIATPYSTSGISLASPIDVKKLPGFTKGHVSVQDLAAQLATQLLAVKPGQRVLDACAAPGGKTAHILEAQPALAELVAIDKDEKRLLRVEENLARLSLSARLICADAADTKTWWDGRRFERILLDAPCSATGVIRRHPDIKYLRQEQDFHSLPQQQLQLLNALWPLLASGGVLVYATCSIMPEENTQTITHFLSSHTDAAELPIKVDWGRCVKLGRQVLPGEANMDGFYYVRIKKAG